MILAEELHHDEEGMEAGMRGSSSHCDYGQEGQGRMGETEGRKKGRRGREGRRGGRREREKRRREGRERERIASVLDFFHLIQASAVKWCPLHLR